MILTIPDSPLVVAVPRDHRNFRVRTARDRLVGWLSKEYSVDARGPGEVEGLLRKDSRRHVDCGLEFCIERSAMSWNRSRGLTEVRSLAEAVQRLVDTRAADRSRDKVKLVLSVEDGAYADRSAREGEQASEESLGVATVGHELERS